MAIKEYRGHDVLRVWCNRPEAWQIVVHVCVFGVLAVASIAPAVLVGGDGASAVRLFGSVAACVYAISCWLAFSHQRWLVVRDASQHIDEFHDWPGLNRKPLRVLAEPLQLLCRWDVSYNRLEHFFAHAPNEPVLVCRTENCSCAEQERLSALCQELNLRAFDRADTREKAKS